MATRAIETANRAGRISHQLSDWRATIDAAFVTAWDDLAAHAGRTQRVQRKLVSSGLHWNSLIRLKCPAFLFVGRISTVRPDAGFGPIEIWRWPLPHVQNWLHHNMFLGDAIGAKGL